jgi:SAM-dependent methyltransferase
LALDPGHAVAALTRGRALVALGRPAEAIAAFDVALAARPGFPEASLGRARACVAAGRPAEALPALRVAAERDPRARWDLGVAELEAGDPTAAAASWQLALAAGVGDPVALGRLLLRTAPPDAAGIPAIRRAAELGVPGAWATLADTVLRFPDAADRDTLLALLARDDIDAQRIEPAVRRRLGPDLAGDPLLIPWLTRTVVADAAAIRRLVDLRDAVATDPASDPALRAAFAAQAWYTGRAWGGQAPTPEARPMYEGTVDPLPPVEIPFLGEPDDPTSVVVRAQYEEHPYPRLVGVHLRERVGLSAYVQAACRLDRAFPPDARVLVAGGGTGRHPIGLASAVGPVTCIDLSRASLAIAAALARRHGIPVRFLHGDLLTLPPELGPFDFVDCVGVLHHLRDPARGLAGLVRQLAPGGLVRLGLYSERGRAEVVAARAVVADLTPDDDGLHTARARLLALPPDHPAAPIAGSVDLWTQPGLRDLVFHPCEHRYTPTQVRALVEGAGLRVAALQHASSEPARLYAARWPEDGAQADLDRWDELERDHPRIFTGMIHVWCERG